MDDHHDIESFLRDNDTFCTVPTITYALPLEEIVGFAQEHEKSGTPYVINGLPLDNDNHTSSPLLQSSKWLEDIYRLRGALFISVRHCLSPILLKHSKQSTERPQQRGQRPHRPWVLKQSPGVNGLNIVKSHRNLPPLPDGVE